MINLKVTENGEFSLVEIEIDGGVCEPADLKTLAIPTVKGNLGVVLSGRAPVWCFATLVHHFHPTKWVGTFDPRMGGAVVVESHTSSVGVGDIIPLP